MPCWWSACSWYSSASWQAVQIIRAGGWRTADIRPLVRLNVSVVARDGDNVTTPSELMRWYSGPTVLAALEAAEPASRSADGLFRMPVQYVNRPDHTFRGYAGTIESGSVAVGDGIAKPIPCAQGMIAVLMPSTLPSASSSGPPELPGLIAASV